MEKTSKGKVVKLNAGWDDVGSWSALYDIIKKDENLNVIKGDVISFDITSSYIRGGKNESITNTIRKKKFLREYKTSKRLIPKFLIDLFSRNNYIKIYA